MVDKNGKKKKATKNAEVKSKADLAPSLISKSVT
jgi:hypothetical protein